jgi:hypothetical protein
MMRPTWRLARLTSFSALALALAGEPLYGLAPARTKENVQRKAVVITHGAKLYDQPRGEGGKQAPFMQVYFLLEGEEGGRVPVSFEPSKSEADGWLGDGTFTEWNTLQMINFEPQSGRELARIFKDAGCSEQFGLSGSMGNCQQLGSEPQRSGRQRDDYSLLVPVFARDRDNYQGGFVRVNAEGPAVTPQTTLDAGRPKAGGASRLGYDLILVVDSTASMQQWFRPTTEALDGFIRGVKTQIGTGESKTPFNVGLLLYRDRKAVPDCDIGFLNKWEVDLTGDIAAVTRALTKATEASCGSDEQAEAVFDAVSRAVQDPKWHDGHYRVILLVGDAPPHPPSDREKNPLGLDVDTILQQSVERDIRFLTVKIGLEDTEAFKDLAFRGPNEVQGRFRAIEPNPAEFKQALLTALSEEWGLLTKTNQIYQQGITPQQLRSDPSIAKKFDVDSYELPIITAHLPPAAGGTGAPEFVEGWVPKKIKGKLALGEYVFMGKTQVQVLANVIETISLAAQDGVTEGSDAFIQSLRTSLATMLKMRPEDLFRSGESLGSMMEKVEILPFKTTVLRFTAEEVNAWKPADFQRLNKILGEKTELLRSFVQKPGNQHLFGSKPLLYVPRDLFP